MARRPDARAEARIDMGPTTYLEHYTSGAYSPFVQETRTGGGYAMLRARQPPGDLSDPPVTDLVLVLMLGDAPVRANHGSGRFRQRARPGEMFAVAPNFATEVLIDGPSEILALAIPDADTAAGSRISERLAPLYAGGFRNDWLRGLLERLWADSLAGAPAGRLLSEDIATLVVGELAREAGRSTRVHKGGLAPRRLAAVRDFVEANLARDVSLAEMAAVAGLSPYHFCRVFKGATGTTPHRYLVERRVRRAQDLLTSLPDEPLAQIALACGFSAQSHFTSTFRAVSGVTPAQFRAGPRFVSG